MSETPNPIEQTVTEVLNMTYSEFNFESNTDVVARIVTIMDDDSKSAVKVAKDEESDAAQEVREILWNRYSSRGVSANVTCQLFLRLGRFDELGWLKEEASFSPETPNYYPYKKGIFFERPEAGE